MKIIFDEIDIDAIKLENIPTEKFTLVIAAAGKGSRLNFQKPKILYPICNHTILEWIVKNFSPFVKNFIFVVSPEGHQSIEQKINELGIKNYTIALQTTPKGMGDAVSCSLSYITTPYTIIVWGDQVAIQPKTILSLLKIFLHSGAKAAITSKKVISPYIHFIRNSSNMITSILQRREGDVMPHEGESDAGLFVLKTDFLVSELDKLLVSKLSLGTLTKEENFLPLFPFIDRELGDIVTSNVIEYDEMMGINNNSDAEKVAAYFKKIKLCQT